jgi:crossover junction endodeoxyribonuclease RuvC
MMILGIDPGLSGGLALVEHGARLLLVDVIDVPTSGEKAKRRVDIAATLRFMQKVKIDHAVIERAQAMPDQGASSGFNYGRAVGALEACVQGMQIPLTIIEASAWKKAHGLIGRDKEDSRQRALQLFPSSAAKLARKLDHNRAESALIAWYGLNLLRPITLAG